MKTLFTAEAISTGGRSGNIADPVGLLNIRLGNPLEPGSEMAGPNPELFFAGAYSACYHGAVINAAKKSGRNLHTSKVRALVSLVEDEDGGYRLDVELHALLPGVAQDEARQIMETAHQTCPYSKALRGETCVRLVADNVIKTLPTATSEQPSRAI